MSKRRKKLNESKVIELLIVWFVFQAVITSSLLKYSNYKSLVSLIYVINIVARLFMIAVGIYTIKKRKINKNHFLYLCIYVIIVVITILYNKSYQFLDSLFIAIFFGNKLSKEQIIKIFFWTILISCGLVVVMYFSGVFPHYVVRRIDGRERAYFGFAHPNSLGYYVMILCFLGVLEIKDKIRYIYIVLLIIVSYFVYVFPNSLSSALLILLLALYLLINKMYIFLFKSNVIKNNLVKYGSMLLVPIIVVFVYWFVTNASNMKLADESLRTLYARFRLGSQAIQQYGIHLFGTRDIDFVGTAARYFENTTKKYFTVDCFYVQILVRYGIIPSMSFFAFYCCCITASIKSKDADVLIMLILMAIYSIIESMALAVPTSFLYIISSGYILKSRKKTKSGAIRSSKIRSTELLNYRT